MATQNWNNLIPFRVHVSCTKSTARAGRIISTETVATMHLIVLVLVLKCSSCQDFTASNDVGVLSELPLDRLLHVKTSFAGEPAQDAPPPPVEVNGEGTVPSALPLRSKVEQHLKRGDQVYEHPKNEKTNVQSIFQTSITALAFLAFGGYLVCLISQAINGKNSAQQQVVVMESLIRRPTRTPRRPQRLRRPTTRRPRRRSRRDVEVRSDVDEMYEVLASFSEEYTYRHTRDFGRYNVTFGKYEG